MSQTKTIFPDWVERYFRKAVGMMGIEYINDSKNGPKFIAHNYLTEEWTPNLTFATTNVSRSIVAADIVAMDSSIPLKKRPVVKTTRGEVPKIATKRAIMESEISQLDIMTAVGQGNISDRLLDDTKACVEGIEATIEYMFLQALSTGTLLVENIDGTKNGVRVTFGYKPENIFPAKTAAWENTATAKPLDDLQQLFDKAAADGNSIENLFISKQYMDYLRNSDQGKQLYANNAGITIANLNTLGRVSSENMAAAIKAEYGADVEVVDQSIRFEKADGTFVTLKPWEQANIVGVPNGSNVGRIVYGTLAEKNHPTPGCDYADNGNYTLVIKYYETDPKSEVTRAEALVIPVIDNAEDIYVLKAGQTSLLSVDNNKVDCDKNGTKVEVKFAAESNVTASVPSGASWCAVTADNKDNVLTVEVAANAGTARKTTITLTDADGHTATIAVNQKAGA